MVIDMGDLAAGSASTWWFTCIYMVIYMMGSASTWWFTCIYMVIYMVGGASTWWFTCIYMVIYMGLKFHPKIAKIVPVFRLPGRVSPKPPLFTAYAIFTQLQSPGWVLSVIHPKT